MVKDTSIVQGISPQVEVDEEGSAPMTIDTATESSRSGETSTMLSEMERVDFSHPDIIRARAAAYGLLLQWAKERRQARKQASQEQPAGKQDAREQICDMPDSEYTTRNQNPTPADTEVGQR
jgi:hypothetical protein